MSEAYFQTIVFSKGERLEERFLKDVGQELPAYDIITLIFDKVASSRMDVSWLCDMYINGEFSLKQGEPFNRVRNRLRDYLSIFFKLRLQRRIKISSLFKLSTVKELREIVTPLHNKNEEMQFDYFEVSSDNRFILYEVTSKNGYEELTSTTLGYAVIVTPYNKRAFVLKDKRTDKMYGINCTELKVTTITNQRNAEASFKFLLTNVITPAELEKLIPDDLLGVDNMFYQLVKYRYSNFSFSRNNLERIKNFLENVKKIYGSLDSKHLYDSILRTDVYLKGYDFFGSLFHYMKDNGLDFDFERLKPLMISIPEHQQKILEDNYGNLSAT